MADFSGIGEKECRRNPLPKGCRLSESRTVVLQSVLNAIKEHGRSSMHEEVCGVLVGSLCWDDGPYLLIDGRIEGKHATHQSGSVTFTSETWTYIHEELGAKHPGRIIVGWYHTHPGFGIFLSNMDAFIHENFFSFPWQPAYVFDPQAETDGFFFRTDGELRQEEVCVAPDAEPVVRKPMLLPSDSDGRLVIEEEKPRLRYWFLVAFGTVLCLAILAAVAFVRFRRDAETQIEKLRGNVEQREEQLRKNADDLVVLRRTYEREIAGLRVRITEISTERRSLEATNALHVAEIARLREEQARQDGAIRDGEDRLARLAREKDEVERALEDARAKARELEFRNAELEKAHEEQAPPGTTEPEVHPASESPPIPGLEEGETAKTDWWNWLKFWKWF